MTAGGQLPEEPGPVQGALAQQGDDVVEHRDGGITVAPLPHLGVKAGPVARAHRRLEPRQVRRVDQMRRAADRPRPHQPGPVDVGPPQARHPGAERQAGRAHVLGLHPGHRPRRRGDIGRRGGRGQPLRGQPQSPQPLIVQLPRHGTESAFPRRLRRPDRGRLSVG
jgi:hypothetical protein